MCLKAESDLVFLFCFFFKKSSWKAEMKKENKESTAFVCHSFCSDEHSGGASHPNLALNKTEEMKGALP